MADDTQQLSLDAQIWKRCPRCGQNYLRHDFANSHCRACHAAYERERRRRRNPSVAVQRRDDAARLRPMGLKRCADCFEARPFEDFHRHRGMRDRLYPYCRSCESERNRANRARRGEVGVMAERARRYGLTVEAFGALLAKGQCDCCGATEPGSKRGWHVDHDHACCSGFKSCGKCVRGLLCARCNVALGMCDDSPDRVRALLRYAEFWAQRKGARPSR